MINIDPIWLPENQQQLFRNMLNAMSYPGRCYPIPTRPQTGHSVLSVLASFLDVHVSLADPDQILDKEDWSMLQMQSSSTEQADYIVCDGRLGCRFEPKLGSLKHPEQSATLFLLVAQLNAGEQKLELTGPGILTKEYLTLHGLEPQWLEKREEWVMDFPMGVDVFFVDNTQISALPRTTKIKVI